MVLTVFERANLLNILPREGNFTTLKMIRRLREDLALSETEVNRYQPKIQDDGRMEWRTADDKGNPIPQDAEIEVSELAFDLIRKKLVEADKAEKLTMEHYSLYEKFVEKDYEK